MSKKAFLNYHYIVAILSSLYAVILSMQGNIRYVPLFLSFSAINVMFAGFYTRKNRDDER